MGLVVRTVAVAVVAGAVSLAAAGPASAKGPDHVAIGVPGGVPVVVSAVDGARTHLAHDLAEDLGVWEVTGDGLALVLEAPTAYLGPSLRVEWTMYNASADPDDAPRVVQTVYPHAAGGALVHTAAGQRYFASDLTRGGWFRAPERLAADLAALGITSEIVVADPAPGPDAAPAGTAAGTDAAARAGRPGGLPVAGAAAVLAAAVVAAALRRSGRGAPVTAD